MWYNFKNCIFALKRNRIFRAVNEVEEIRNQIIELYANEYDLEYKHFKDLDNLPANIKQNLKKCFIKEVSYQEIKSALICSLNEFCKYLKKNNLNDKAKSYKEMFENLFKEVSL